MDDFNISHQTQGRNIEIKDKFFKIVFQIFTVLCITGIAASVICDFSLNKAITWSLYPLISIIFLWIICTPALILKSHKILSSIIAITIVVFPYLYILDKITDINSWFKPLAVPITITSLIAIWVSIIVFYILKKKFWYFCSFITFIFGIIVNGIVQYYVNQYTGTNILTLSLLINVSACLLLTVLFAFLGNRKYNKIEEG